MGIILGGFIPLGILLLKFSFDNKVHSYKDVKVKNAALLGDVPAMKDKNKLVDIPGKFLTHGIYTYDPRAT